MEEDRAQADLGIAADIEESHAQPPTAATPSSDNKRQPKKRFVGRRTAAKHGGAGSSTTGENGAIQGERLP